MKTLACITAVGFALMTTTQAHALSCASSGFELETSYKANKKAGKNITYVMGSFTGGTKQKKKPKLTGTGINGGIQLIPQNGKGSKTKMHFSGKKLVNGKEKAFKTKVTVETTCINVWCGNPPKPNTTTIATLEKTTSGYVLKAGPCSPNTFSAGLVNDWDKLKRLMR